MGSNVLHVGSLEMNFKCLPKHMSSKTCRSFQERYIDHSTNIMFGTFLAFNLDSYVK